MTPRPRLCDDGSLMYPKRGNPPPVIEGYLRDPSDPYTLRPQYPECVYREDHEYKVPCNLSPTGFRLEVLKICTRGFRVSYTECTECVRSGRRDQGPRF